ncbi:MAG: biotin/lipoyl-containing protein, partial [Pseudomonas sp.]|nr:biotin/lipoyl-containing protein [Pseudomonas sp.]
AMMDAFRSTVGPDVELQTLARGINVVGLESQSSDIIRLHAQLFKKHGVDTIRNFDALNDVNNLIFSGRCIAEAGLKHQVAITMMELPPGCEGAHTPEFYLQVLKDILVAEIPFDSVCFKDASGTSTPSKVFKTIKAARELLPEGTFINFHTHDTAGNAVIAYRAALDAGADGIDLAMSPVSGGTGQPDIITMWHALRGTEFDLGIDINKIVEAERVFADCMKDYFVPPEARAVDPVIIFSPMPGGALTANTQMMRDSGVLGRYPEVIRAMSEVVVKGGFGTSVTPVSQFYFQQAYNNVMLGPWKKIAEGYGKMVLGYFGKTPVQADAQIMKVASEQLNLPPTTVSPLELNDADPARGIAPARKKLTDAELPVTDENIFIAATCKDKGIAWLKGEARVAVRKNVQTSQSSERASVKEQTSEQKARAYNVQLENQTFSVYFEGDKAVVNGKSYSVDVAEIAHEIAHEIGSSHPVTSPLPGVLMRLNCREGDMVGHQDTLFVVEAMKMETEIKAPVAGKITRIAVEQGSQLTAGQTVIHIG